ncbi:MAG: hypothetical protein IPO31_16365 [Candidatus Obscuribacter sp.]|nr:hypothetical protein [Candidatus Obscuribacter sp.]
MRETSSFIIDWSWFAVLGAAGGHCHHNDAAPQKWRLYDYRQDLLEAYCFESGRQERTYSPPCPMPMLSAVCFSSTGWSSANPEG